MSGPPPTTTAGSPVPSSSETWRRVSLSIALLGLVLLTAFPLIAWYHFADHGWLGVQAAAIAGAICGLSAIVALLITAIMSGPQAVQGLLLSMLIRMGLPLGMGLLLSETNDALAQVNVFGMIVINYLLALALETVLAVWVVGASQKIPSATVSKAS